LAKTELKQSTLNELGKTGAKVSEVFEILLKVNLGLNVKKVQNLTVKGLRMG